MARWVAFDSTSAERLREFQPQEAVALESGTAIQAAIKDSNDSVIMMSGGDSRNTWLLRVQHAKPKESMQYIAGGFLGLSDEAVIEDEPADEKKSWWKRVF